MLVIVDIGNAFEEEQRKDVALEVRRVHRPAQDIGRFPEMGFKLAECDRVGGHADEASMFGRRRS